MRDKIVLGFKKIKRQEKFFPFGEGNYILKNNFSDYLDEIEVNITSKEDLIIINSELYSSTLLPADFKGIDLVEWIRIKLQKLNPILVVGFTPLEQLVNLKSESIILFGESTFYRQLPISDFHLNDLINKMKPLDDKNELKSKYYHLVSKTFDIKGFEHSFANKYGITLMKQAFENATNEEFSINETNSKKIALNFAKADMLFRELAYDTELFFKDQVLDRTGKGSIVTFRELMQKPDNRIFHIDDEGEKQNWYAFIKKLGNLDDSNYKMVTNHNLIKNDNINTDYILNQLKKFKPNLILIDLRLLGQKEANVEEFYDYTGAELIENIRIANPWIPIIVVSATGQIKSLENLQEHPYNISSLWSKPRVDTGKIDIHEKLNDLLVKMNSALNLYKHDADRWITEIKFRIKNNETTVELNTAFIDQYDEFIFDTNFFCETSKEIINHHLYFSKLVKYLSNNNKHVTVIDDVFTEVFLNSIKTPSNSNINPEDFKKISSFSLNELTNQKREGKIQRFNTRISKLVNKELVPEQVPNTIDNSKRDILFSYKIKQEEGLSKAQAKKRISLYKKNLKQKSNIHADNIFKFLIKDLISTKKVLFISEDLFCKQEIALMIDKDIDVKKYFFKKFLNKKKRVIDYKTFKHVDLLNLNDQDGSLGCTLMKNSTFIYNISKNK